MTSYTIFPYWLIPVAGLTIIIIGCAYAVKSFYKMEKLRRKNEQKRRTE